MEKEKEEKKVTLADVGVKNTAPMKLTRVELICLKAMYSAAMQMVVQPALLPFCRAVGSSTNGAGVEEIVHALEHLESLIGDAIHDNGWCPNPKTCEYKK